MRVTKHSRDPRARCSMDEVKHIQAVFSSKEERLGLKRSIYAYYIHFSLRLKLSDSHFSIPVSANRQDLSSLVSHLLQSTVLRAALSVCTLPDSAVADSDSESDDGAAEREVEFIIHGDLLHSTLEKHIAWKDLTLV